MFSWIVGICHVVTVIIISGSAHIAYLQIPSGVLVADRSPFTLKWLEFCVFCIHRKFQYNIYLLIYVDMPFGLCW